jgi:hypothetical protein
MHNNLNRMATIGYDNFPNDVLKAAYSLITFQDFEILSDKGDVVILQKKEWQIRFARSYSKSEK